MIAQRLVVVRAYPSDGQGREWRAPLYITASVEQTRRSRPNKGTVQIYNLSRESIAFLEGAALVEVYAGERSPSLLFRGEPARGGIKTTYKGEDVVTELELADARSAYRDARLSRSYSPGTRSDAVIADLAGAMGLPIAYQSPDLEVLEFEGGYTVSGPCRRAMDDLIATIGAEWSVQDGALHLLAGGDNTVGQAQLLKAGTGLIDSPTKKDKGIEIKALLMPHLRPGKVVCVESRAASGYYRLTRTVHDADSLGEKWTSTLEARAL